MTMWNVIVVAGLGMITLIGILLTGLGAVSMHGYLGRRGVPDRVAVPIVLVWSLALFWGLWLPFGLGWLIVHAGKWIWRDDAATSPG